MCADASPDMMSSGATPRLLRAEKVDEPIMQQTCDGRIRMAYHTRLCAHSPLCTLACVHTCLCSHLPVFALACVQTLPVCCVHTCLSSHFPETSRASRSTSQPALHVEASVELSTNITRAEISHHSRSHRKARGGENRDAATTSARIRRGGMHFLSRTGSKPHSRCTYRCVISASLARHKGVTSMSPARDQSHSNAIRSSSTPSTGHVRLTLQSHPRNAVSPFTPHSS